MTEDIDAKCKLGAVHIDSVYSGCSRRTCVEFVQFEFIIHFCSVFNLDSRISVNFEKTEHNTHHVRGEDGGDVLCILHRNIMSILCNSYRPHIDVFTQPLHSRRTDFTIFFSVYGSRRLGTLSFVSALKNLFTSLHEFIVIRFRVSLGKCAISFASTLHNT